MFWNYVERPRRALQIPIECTYSLDRLTADVRRDGDRTSRDVVERLLDLDQITFHQFHFVGDLRRIAEIRKIAETPERRRNVDIIDRPVELSTNLRVQLVEHIVDLLIRLIQLASEELTAEMSLVDTIVDHREDTRVQIGSTDDQIRRFRSDEFI